jgi:hypothetical protein
MPNALPRELDRNAAVGIEPTPFDFEVTHSLATGTVCCKSPGKSSTGGIRLRELAISFRLP